jgi:SET domain-containing protein
MVNNSANINKMNNGLSPKESLNSDGQQFCQYQQNEQSPLTKRKFKLWWSTIPPNINKMNNGLSPKESLNSNGQQFYQFQQTNNHQSPLT